MKSAKTRHWLANTLGGLFVGIGLSLMLTLYGRVSWSSAIPNLVIVVCLAVGLGIGLLPVRTTRVQSDRR